uniref:Transmembrane protein 183 n=1 Tax=Glossina pallidipes TaxID=7398 RepID=A0A1A9ZVJ1_GLOPL
MSYGSEDVASFVESDDAYLERIIGRSTRHSAFLNPPMVLNLKLRKRQGKCVGPALEVINGFAKKEESKHKKYNYICYTVWLLLADYIAPEDVQTYALICRQSANSIAYCRYWKNLYASYCGQSRNSKIWILNLPERLQRHNMHKGDVRCIRRFVIESLFYCYQPFVKRTQQKLNVDFLIGRTFMRSWITRSSNYFTTYIEFKLGFPLNADKKDANSVKSQLLPHKLVDNWEDLANDDDNVNTEDELSTIMSLAHDLEGVCLLLLCSSHFVSVPSQLQYNKNSNRRVRLHSTRTLLSSDMKTSNLKLDFMANIGNEIITICYPNILWFKVVPWWYPDFFSHRDTIVG